MTELLESQQLREENRRFKVAMYFMGIVLRKIEPADPIDFAEVAEDAVTAADALINALRNKPVPKSN